ncbi:N-carbamoyl-D-amino acid hydrolase [Hartmannibacter diazotrophicus]|uniref:N-carbamoyl-D-amino acid hydrolase n=1 Tax=Hartmannibacter diazotrophicus TaxID=1482074 RepID=A0A2C9DB93_9HYPH|nr:N-carbamoyl-D-amino-acid hydrolase [Hartmannibacter diazotrophicus]SON57526.1 N-carbamoyl-D-amino acid hydrolase [Hartmannibacter diazotrophicus]
MSNTGTDRKFIAASAQLGPIACDEPRSSVVGRMLALLDEAKARGVSFVVFPELALTTFFPRWFFGNDADLDVFYERAMPNADVAPLFEAAKAAGIGFHLGYAELAEEEGRAVRYNTAILVDREGKIALKYRKIHLPGHREHEPERPFQHLEKRYFTRGNLGFPVADVDGGRYGTLICNDRRWPEAFRMLGLQGAELVAVGYNTPQHYPPAPEHDHLQDFHNHLSLQAGAYQNGTYVIGSAKAGFEEGCELIGGSCIVAPTGEIVALAATRGDELVTAPINLDRCREIKANIFNFALHREPDTYGLLTAPKDA